MGKKTYEGTDLIRQLKTLAKTQTAFLKLWLHGKLVATKLIVEVNLQY